MVGPIRYVIASLSTTITALYLANSNLSLFYAFEIVD